MNQKLEVLKKITVSKEFKLLECLKIMDLENRKLLLVMEQEKFLSLLSIGDIQRAIISNVSLDSEIKHILRKEVDVAYEKDSFETIKQKMLSYRAEYMPILNNSLEVVDIYFWDDIFKEKDTFLDNERIDIPVVIMAGGKGTRLKPLTNVIPKPLIPIGEETIMEHIINNFHKIGCNNFYATVNYKADMIEYYFNNLKKTYTVDYALEKEFLGTAGSIYLLKEKIKETFFVSNCDILINEDYREIYKNHKQKEYDITIVVAIKNFSIPYGTIELDNDGLFKELREKPELSYMINTGMYILEPKIIEEINPDEFIHITTLIENCHKKGMKVGIFPISEASWMDMGQWNEYHKTLDEFERKFSK
jgi:dTDP-glucose pyrophosphorylase